MKYAIFALAALMTIATAEAKRGGRGGGNRAKIQQEQKEKKAKKDERDKKREAVDAVLKVKDGNHDGSLTLDEYLTGESDVAAATAKFNEFNKNGDRYLSKGEIETSLGL